MIGMTVAHCQCQYWFHLEAEGPITKGLIEICGAEWAKGAKRLSCHWSGAGGVGGREGWVEGGVGAVRRVEDGAVQRKPGT